MKKILLTVFILTFSIINLFSQDVLTATSGNSLFFAVAKHEGKTKEKEQSKLNKHLTKKVTYYGNIVDIYQIKTLDKLRSFEFWVDNKEPINEVYLSNDGVLCYAKQGSVSIVWNIVTGETLYEGNFVRKIGFSNQSAIFAVADNMKLYTYDGYSGEIIQKYSYSPALEIETIKFTDDDSKIIVKSTIGKYSLFNLKTGKLLRNFTANNLVYTNDNENISVLKISENKVSSTIYDTIKYEKIKDFNSTKVISQLNAMFKQEVKNGTLTDFTPLVLVNGKTKITNDGGYIMMLTQRGNDNYVLLCFNNQTHEYVSLVSTASFVEKIDLQNYDVYDDANLVIPLNNNSAGIFDIEQGIILNQIDYLFEETLDGSKNPLVKQMKTRKISPNYKYVIMENTDNKKQAIYARSTIVKQPSSVLKGLEFISYSPNSKYIFAKNQEDKYGYIKSIDVAADLSDSSKVKFNIFGDSLVYPTPEDFITIDSDYPDGYEFNVIRKFKYIGDCDDSMFVHLHLKTVATDETQTGVQVHLIDDDGTYYYGASEDKWKFVWNNVIIQSDETNKLTKITDFTVSEYMAADSLPNAIAIVLDHSGSMGEERAKALQKAATNFIEKKNPQDGMAILKYDSKIGLDTKFTTDKQQLLNKLGKNGLSGYGGSTSILDAIDVAATILEKQDGYVRKSIVILTDGNENSSIHTKGQVLKHSVNGDINIYTIGFGSFISEDYLKALSFYTQGTYYQIFKTEQFNYIFDDIYKKMNYYYSINFKTDSIGAFTTLIEIALDERRKDSLVTSFSNEPVDFEAMDIEVDENEPQFNTFVAPVKDVDIAEFNFEAFNNFTDSLEVVEQAKIDSIKIEFQKIDFPDVKFIFNETTIIVGSEKGIEQVIDFMNKNKDIEIEIRGHTDDIGTDEDNQKLSYERALKVKQLLVDAKIKESRISVVGLGETQPISKLNTDEARAINRRVEFIIKDINNED